MTIRSIALSSGLVAVAALLVGCGGGENKGGPSAKGTAAKPAATAAATAKATATATATAAAAPAAEGTGVIKGIVNFTGKAPEMKAPKKRKDADVCKDKDIAHNAVVVKDGKLADVFVSLSGAGLAAGSSDKAVEIHQKDCVYSPRIQGALPGQKIAIYNDDATLHNVHAYFGADSPINQAQPKGAPAIEKSFDEPGVYKMQCDVHPWMRSFVVVSESKFFSVSGADGSFSIEKVPAGSYTLTAWHSTFGKKEAKVEVKDGEVKVDFSFDGKEAEPSENAGELKDLF